MNGKAILVRWKSFDTTISSDTSLFRHIWTQAIFIKMTLSISLLQIGRQEYLINVKVCKLWINNIYSQFTYFNKILSIIIIYLFHLRPEFVQEFDQVSMVSLTKVSNALLCITSAFAGQVHHTHLAAKTLGSNFASRFFGNKNSTTNSGGPQNSPLEFKTVGPKLRPEARQIHEYLV